MTTSRKILLPIVVIPLLAAAGLFLVKRQIPVEDGDTPTALLDQGSIVPDFEINQFKGGQVKLSKIARKVVLINFWATWCEPCRTEMPSIGKLRAAYKDKGLDVIAINIDEDPESVVPAALKSMGVDFPVYVDPEGRVAEIFDVHAVPLTVIIDGNRKILLVEAGERDWNSKEVRKQLESWLAG